jgi:hypothetical protein
MGLCRSQVLTIKTNTMEKSLKFKAVNGMTVKAAASHVTGIGVRLDDGTYLTVEVVGGLSFPVHPSERKSVWGKFVPAEEGGAA